MACCARKFVPATVSGVVDISKVPGCHFLRQMSSQCPSQKLLQGLVYHGLIVYLSVFDPFLTQWIMTILSKGYKPDNLERNNSLKRSFLNIEGWMWIFTWIKLSWNSWSVWEKLVWPSWFLQSLCEGISSFNPKELCYSYAWSCRLCERKTSFCTGHVARKHCGFFFFVFEWFYFTQCLTSFFSINQLLHLYAWFFTLFHLT